MVGAQQFGAYRPEPFKSKSRATNPKPPTKGLPEDPLIGDLPEAAPNHPQSPFWARRSRLPEVGGKGHGTKGIPMLWGSDALRGSASSSPVGTRKNSYVLEATATNLIGAKNDPQVAFVNLHEGRCFRSRLGPGAIRAPMTSNLGIQWPADPRQASDQSKDASG